MAITVRRYHDADDRVDLVRVWTEIGWLDPGREQEVDWFLDGSRGYVGELDGRPECFVFAADGFMLYLDQDLPFSAITAVTTGRAARRLGLAHRTLAFALAAEARQGAVLSALGVFDQGFYDELGYGTGSYIRRIIADPASFHISARARVPERLGGGHWQEVHAARLRRRRTHGACNLKPAGVARREISDPARSFGMGYRDEPDGGISHMLWCWPAAHGRGPWDVELVFRTRSQLEELLALLKAWSDEVTTVRFREPPGVIAQDLLDRPFRGYRLTRGTEWQTGIRCWAGWQARILDLQASVAAVRCPGEVAFNLEIEDPLASYGEASEFGGLSGTYVVRLGERSLCEAGSDADLPTLRSSIGAFTRLWLGVAPASGIAMTDRLFGPDHLIEQLDAVLRLPEPQPDWDF